jgi:hypothetical protein
MNDMTPITRDSDMTRITRDGASTTRHAELLRELFQPVPYQLDAETRSACAVEYEMAWEQAAHTVELCRRAAELAARR